jgi:flagellar motor protein MotB
MTTTTRARSVLCSTVACLVPLFLASAASAAGKPAAKAKAAKPAAAKSKSDSGSSSSSSSSESKPATPYETPSPAGAPAPTPSSTTTSGSETAAKPADSPSSEVKKEEPKEAAKETSMEAPKDATASSSESAPATVIEEPEPPAEPLPLYVEHLGPSSYPGTMRGIYGGSMWLEPSFHGLQWPYMAKSGVGVSGWVWVDTGNERITRDLSKLGNTSMLLQQGRAALRVTPTYTSGNFFIQGQVELVGNQCQQAGGSTSSCQTFGTFDTDDLWIRFGQWNLWDLKFGRFESWELYHTGMGLDLNTLERQGAAFGPHASGGNIDSAPTFSGPGSAVNFLHERPTAGLGVGYIAFHGYLSDRFRIEILSELGTDDSTGNGYNYEGGRPAIIYDAGWLKLKLGAEYERQTESTQQIVNGQGQDSPYQQTKKDLVGGVQFVMAPWIEFGGNAAYGTQSYTNDSGTADGKRNFNMISLGGFANMRLARLWILGAGANWVAKTDSFYANGSSTADYSAHLQGFLAIQGMVAKQLFIKTVFGYARSDFQDTDPTISIFSNYMYSVRVRMMYLY